MIEIFITLKPPYNQAYYCPPDEDEERSEHPLRHSPRSPIARHPDIRDYVYDSHCKVFKKDTFSQQLLLGSTCAEKLIADAQRQKGTKKDALPIANVNLVDLYKAGHFSEHSFIDISTEALWKKFFGLDGAPGSQPYDFEADRHWLRQAQGGLATEKQKKKRKSMEIQAFRRAIDRGTFIFGLTGDWWIHYAAFHGAFAGKSLK